MSSAVVEKKSISAFNWIGISTAVSSFYPENSALIAFFLLMARVLLLIAQRRMLLLITRKKFLIYDIWLNFCDSQSYPLVSCNKLMILFSAASTGYSTVWRALWAYNAQGEIGRGRSPRPISPWALYAHNALQTVLHLAYTMVTLKICN